MPPLGRLAALAAVASLALALPPPAGARKFQMSGRWIVRNGAIFLPLQFAATAMGTGMQITHASMGNLTEARGFPNGPIPGQGGVTATGSAPATLRIPPHRFVEDAMVLFPFTHTSLVQLTTNIGIDAPYAAATLAAGGGPGSFTWCPGNPACVAGGGMLSTDPPALARVIYRAGANRFGGVMQLGLRRGGVVSFPFGSGSPRRAGQVFFVGDGTTLHEQAVGGLGSADIPATAKVYLARGFVTQPTIWPAMGSPILHPGPKMTTMFGLTSTGTGAVYYLTHIAIGPMGTPAAQFTTQDGFAHTTGTVFVQQTAGSDGDDFFTAMGSDARTPLGAGNLSLVAGGLTYRRDINNPGRGTPSGAFDKVRLTLAPPIPSLSPAGLAAAAALVLLAVGYALRRRLAAH